MIIFLFSGQGSQYYQMGKELYYREVLFRQHMETLNSMVYKHIGISIIDEMYNERKMMAESFDRLLYTYPAIFMVEYSLARVLIESGIQPDYVLGASLGEITAATVAEVIPVEKTLECLLKWADLIEKNCAWGSMIAILERARLYHQAPVISMNSELAAVNYFSHFVVSGERSKLLKVAGYLKKSDILFQYLPVKYGFHSSNIDLVESDYKNVLHNFAFQAPKIPVMSCSLAGAAEFCCQYFWDSIRQPVCFEKTILEFEKRNWFDYIDVGPSGTLANFVKKILGKDSKSQVYDILTPYRQDVRKIEKVRLSLKKLG